MFFRVVLCCYYIADVNYWSLLCRPLVASEFSNNILTLFVLHMLSVPGLVYHVHNTCQEVCQFLVLSIMCITLARRFVSSWSCLSCT